ncbi:MAG: bifunctional nuclease family protein [Gemmatimonadota bacterium]|nr:bifunctional nuclease family protein [Gemmatimonadota bacterium]MDH5284148.1 bifunctional nuclease family protein [Gemmatimonadota bacterium]
MIEVVVAQLGMDRTSNSPVVILRERDGTRVLPIWIGPAEASAIAMEMQGIRPPRPMTHDLLKTVIHGLGASVTRIRIGSLKEKTYLAELWLARGDHVFQLDARPSDSIAIALRTNAPIFTEAGLLDEVDEDEAPAPDPNAEAERLRAWLENMNPEDFGKFQP